MKNDSFYVTISNRVLFIFRFAHTFLIGGGSIMKDISTMTIEERQLVLARREYFRKWREQNKDKIEQHRKNFFLKSSKNISETGTANS